MQCTLTQLFTFTLEADVLKHIFTIVYNDLTNVSYMCFLRKLFDIVVCYIIELICFDIHKNFPWRPLACHQVL